MSALSTLSKPLFSVLLPISVLTAGEESAEGSAKGIERAFSVAAGGALVVHAESATLEVSGGSDDVQVRMTRGGDDADDLAEDYDITFDQDDDAVRVQVIRKKQLFRSSRKPLSIAIATPTDFNAELTSGGSVQVMNLSGALGATTSGGSVRIDNVEGAIVARTSGGSIRHAGTSATMDAKTSGGSIAIEDIQGVVRAQTSGGRIAIGHAGGAVWAKTSGGSIAIESALDAIEARTSGGGIKAAFHGQPQGDSELTTSGGSIAVHLGPETGFDMDARASGGRVRVEGLPIEVEGDIDKHSLQGRINGGGAALTARTSGGSIVVASRP